jgi:hypothetical protein
MKLKDLLNENVLGQLPSSKLMKMKWNPITGKKSQVKEDKINEEYVEVMNMPVLANSLGAIKKEWDKWKNGPLTEPSDIRPAQRELTGWITRWMKQNIK